MRNFINKKSKLSKKNIAFSAIPKILIFCVKWHVHVARVRERQRVQQTFETE